PHADNDPDDSELLRLIKGRVVHDRRCLHLPTPAKETDLYVSLLRGGHGLGDVLERAPESVRDDVREGHLLKRFAETVYGVALTDDGEVDSAGTDDLREAHRRRRAERAIPVADWLKKTREDVLAKNFIEPVKEMYRSSMDLSEPWAAEFRTFWDLPADFEF
ncbi:MAG TPA: acetone carboxylase subunit alpha, partial [Chloroflexota bacterium]|nr:acetone carboxylase subunit alpha [Chloroflexota bacterium]